MRELIAKLVGVLTVGGVVALSFLFASAHDPRFVEPVRPFAVPLAVAGEVNLPEQNQANGKEPREGAARTKPAGVDRGRAVYAQQNCATCHAIAGVGNPRYRLDGVGTRWDGVELRAWITATGVAAVILSAAIAKRKQRYQTMPAEDLDALVAYLSTLKAK